jgi:hypothetical protein
MEFADSADYVGLSLRELIHEFKWQTLVLFKCALLQPKVRLPKLARSASLTRARFFSLVLIASGYA